MNAICPVIPLMAEGVGARSESLRSFLFALSRQNSMPVQDLVHRILIAGTDIREQDGESKTGNLGPDINGHHTKTLQILNCLEYLGFGEMHQTSLIAFRDVSGASMASLLRPERSWCPLCWREALESNNRPNDMLIWAIRFVQRCVYHGVALEQKCPNCGAKQFRYAASGHTRCCHCRLSLIPDRKMARKRVCATASENNLVSIMEASAVRPKFAYKQENILLFTRMYQRELSKLNADAYRSWQAERGLLGWTRLRRTARVVSLLAYAAHLRIPIRLLLERPFEAVRVAQVPKEFGPSNLLRDWPLNLEEEEVVDGEMSESTRERPLSWDEQLWIPGQSAALDICSDKHY